jgi:hypothetical protein
LAKKDDVATVLAAQCLETAIDMPIEVRQQIEKRLQRLVPPRDFEGVSRLQPIGMTVAPLLLRSLQNGNAQERTTCLMALDEIDYEPAIPIIVKCSSDSERSNVSAVSYGLSVGEYAIFVLFRKTATSEAARRACVDIMRRPQNPEFLKVLAEWGLGHGDNEWAEKADQLIQTALKAAKQETSTSTPARSTG